MVTNFKTTLQSGLAEGGSETTITLSSVVTTDGHTLVMTDIGDIGFIILAPTSSNIEICSFTGMSGTTLTGVTRGLAFYGSSLSAVSANKKAHSAGETIIISNNHHWFKEQYVDVDSAQSIGGVKTFSHAATPRYDSHPTFSDDLEFVDKKYADDLAIAGAPDGSTSVKGIFEEATAAEINAGTQTGGTSAELTVNPKYLKDSNYYTQLPSSGEKAAAAGNNTDVAVGSGNKFVTQTGLQHGAEKYAADSGSNDSYAVTLSPVPTSYTDGMVVHFKANTVNTGACTLNVNSLGAKTIKKNYNSDLADGDIKANQLVSVIYDGTNFQMLSPVGNAPLTTLGTVLGSWASASADGNAHQVSYDSLLVVVNSSSQSITIYTDSSNPPTTVRGKCIPDGAAARITATVPVKKNDYYKITGTTESAYIITIGS